MYRGTTPTITMKLNADIDFSTIEQIWVTFKSWDNEITKDIDDVTFDSTKKTIAVSLTQEDTLSFTVGDISVQLRIVLSNGQAFATTIKKLSSEKILKDGVIASE